MLHGAANQGIRGRIVGSDPPIHHAANAEMKPVTEDIQSSSKFKVGSADCQIMEF